MDRPVYYNDAFGLFVLGGSELISSFTGIIASATIHRTHYYNLKNVKKKEKTIKLLFNPIHDIN